MMSKITVYFLLASIGITSSAYGIEVIPENHDEESMSWIFVTPAFDEIYDVKYKNKRYRKIGIPRSFIKEQDDLKKGDNQYLGYVYTREGEGFPPILRLTKIQLDPIPTKMFTNTRVYEIQMGTKDSLFTVILRLEADPDSLKRIWYKKHKNKIIYSQFDIDELVPSEYHPLFHINLKGLFSYDDKYASPQLYERTVNEIIGYNNTFYRLYGASYTQPDTEESRIKRNKMSKKELLRYRRGIMDYKGLILVP